MGSHWCELYDGAITMAESFPKTSSGDVNLTFEMVTSG